MASISAFKTDNFDADVVIVGAGPVGTFLAIWLGQRGKKVKLVERWMRHYELPRAVTYDHEIARILATLGIDSENDPAINFHDELYYWKNASRENIQIVDWQSQSASGWRVRYWFNQPELEKRFLAMAAKLPTVETIRGYDAINLSEDPHGVTLTLKQNREEYGADGKLRTIRAKFVVGADGANSFVRNALGIENEDKGFFYDWLILDMIPKGEYVMKPAQWQLCDPKRPTTIVPGGPGRRRWEFMVLQGESAEEMQKPENAWRLLEPWGIRPDNADLERSAVYRFQARWATQWNKGRCLIAGDAAHLMPPFAGEGMCAGIRDALAAAWRLDGILDGKFGVEVLDSYTTERKEHAKHYINFSQDLGKIICIAEDQQAAERDARMKAELEARNFAPVPTDICQLGRGVWCDESAHAGELSVQGVVNKDGTQGRFDQAVGTGWSVIAYDADPTEALTPEQRAQIELLEGRLVRIGAPGSACDAEDVSGTYAEWMKKIDAKYVLVRPDFYVAVTANSPAAFQQRFAKVMGELHMDQTVTRAVA